MGKTSPAFASKGSFARKMLQNQGWSEGQGLGKSNQGIPEALRPHLKFDTSGMGHDPAKEFTDHWWSDAYNKTSKKITIVLDDDDTETTVEAKAKVEPEAEVTPPSASRKYRGFVKSATLQGGHLVETKEQPKPVAEETAKAMTDEDLFRACDGLTGHKGARHGITMKAKLARIDEMERELISKMAKKRRTKKCSLHL